MRRLHEAKKLILATNFVEEIEKYKKENNGKYPKYKSSYKFYKDVFVNLLICQQGLCAYSEMAIDLDYNKKNNSKLWETGRFIGEKPRIDADIEHYKPKSKCELECDWEWDNLFLVSKHINQSIKRDKAVFDFMRPDNINYFAQKYMDYNFHTQMFVPNPALDDNIYDMVDKTIETLGLNISDTVKSKRKNMLLTFLNEVFYEKYSYNEIKKTKLREFPTAFEMCKNIFENKIEAEKFITVK